MPFPKWLAKVNRRVTNRILLRLGPRPPFGVLTHEGRRTGRSYRIPLNVFPTPTGFVFALTYGADTDWVRNVLAAGGAELEFGGESIELVDPRLVDGVDAAPFLPLVVRFLLAILRVKDFLACDRVELEAA